MQRRIVAAGSRAVRLALGTLFLVGCQALPPEHGVVSRAGPVRARDAARAGEVARLLEELEPRVVAAVPNARPRRVEVWVQESPALYRFASSAYQDADGFYCDATGRIHLRERADSLERTLAHELVHAHLDGAWNALPGTIEEGLCDHISAELCADARTRLRLGRLTCAAFALGGLELELSVQWPARAHPSGTGIAFDARLRLESEPPLEIDPLGVFERQAGLSSTDLDPARKKAYYGLAFLVVRRVAAHEGLQKLFERCEAAREDDRPRLTRREMLEAARLDENLSTWRDALAEEITEEDLRELVRLHPEFLVQSLDDFLGPCTTRAELERAFVDVQATLAVRGGAAQLELLSEPSIRAQLCSAFEAREGGSLARR